VKAVPATGIVAVTSGSMYCREQVQRGVGGERASLRAGILLLIPRGTTHEIRNNGRAPLKTLNLYVPPAYTSDGEPLPRGK
jgi:mannose-6-phosphate isomerase-like protein (cupin superfamily)